MQLISFQTIGRMQVTAIVRGLLYAFTLIMPMAAQSQTMPDSVIVIKNMYANMGWTDGVDRDSLYSANKYVFKRSTTSYESDKNTVDYSLVKDLISEINDTDNLRNTLDRYGLDTAWIKANAAKALKTLPYAKRFAWNRQQTELINKELVKIKYYEDGFAEYLANGCCYTMHSNYRYEYIMRLYHNGQLISEITSRKQNWGYRYPWTNDQGKKLYSFKIENILDSLVNSRRKVISPMLGHDLFKKLADRILQINSEALRRLAPYTYERELDELKSAFTISSFSEMSGYGGYHGDPKIQVILHNTEMIPNVSIEFLASKQGKTIYPRDSVIKGYKYVVDRVQSVKFIVDYLKANPQQSLHILYFDNKPINKYNIDHINKNPEEWKKYKADVEGYKWYERNNIKPSFDIEEALKTSERLYCGCNYRFSNEVMEGSIVFIIDDKEKEHSRWVLLPDNTVLLFYMSGEKVLNYSYNDFGKYPGLQEPCIRFDGNGKIAPKAVSAK